MQKLIKLTAIILFIGLSNQFSYSQTKGIAQADGTFLVLEFVVLLNFNSSLTTNIDEVAISEIKIEDSNLIFEGFDKEEKLFRYELNLENVDGILYLKSTEELGDEIQINEGTTFNYADFYSKITK